MKNNEVSLADEWRGEFVEGVERLRSDLRKIKKSWDNRLAAKRCPFSEVYLNGDADIVLYGNRLTGEDRVEWVVRIAADLHVLESVGARDGVYVFDIYDGCARGPVAGVVGIGLA